MGNKTAWWLGIMFLTNVFFIPFLAMRAAPEPEEPASSSGGSSSSIAPQQAGGLPGFATGMGITGAAVGLLSVAWALAARPEFGDLSARLAYFQSEYSSNRVSALMGVAAVLCHGLLRAAMLSSVARP